MMHPLRKQASSRPDRKALSSEGRRWTWSELESDASNFAISLRDRFGIEAGDRISTVMGNTPEHALLICAAGIIGAAPAPLSVRLTKDEFAPCISSLNPRLIITDSANISRTISEAAAGIPALRFDGSAFRGQTSGIATTASANRRKGEAVDHCFPAFDPTRIAAIIHTSGSSGSPKPAPLTWGNFIESAVASAANLGLKQDDNWLCAIPFFHIGGYSILMRGMLCGMHVTLSGSTDTDDLLDVMRSEEISIVSLVPTMLLRLMLREKDFSSAHFPKLRAILLGGAPIPAAVLEESHRRGLPVLPTYGLTEACSQVATTSPGEIPEPGCAGKPLPGFTVEIRDEDGNSPESGASGEIWIKGPAVISGYLDGSGPESFSDGFFRTGDTGFMDSRGRLHVHGRSDDVIITGGENVAPAEVENVLLSHPLVLAACVAGVADAEWGQVVAAAVAPKSAELELRELESYCRQKLAGFKVPKKWMLIPEMPVSEAGKISRRAVRELFAR